MNVLGTGSGYVYCCILCYYAGRLAFCRVYIEDAKVENTKTTQGDVRGNGGEEDEHGKEANEDKVVARKASTQTGMTLLTLT